MHAHININTGKFGREEKFVLNILCLINKQGGEGGVKIDGDSDHNF